MKKLTFLLFIWIPILSFSRERFFDAASKGDTNSIMSYIAGGGDINAQSFSKDSTGWTALMFAVDADREDAVKLLISARPT